MNPVRRRVARTTAAVGAAGLLAIPALGAGLAVAAGAAAATTTDTTTNGTTTNGITTDGTSSWSSGSVQSSTGRDSATTSGGS